jgi:NADPH2:quinone reductase
MGLLKVPILHPYLLLSQSKSFIGINIKRISEQRPELLSFSLEEVFNMVRDGKVKPYIDSIFQFHDCPMAHRRLQGRQSIGKVVVSLGGAML